MSGAMEEAEEFWSRGLLGVKETQTCLNHIDEPAIKNYIRREGAKGKCTYCHKYLLVVSLEKLLFFITDGICHFYKDPADFMYYESAEGGYQGEVMDAAEIMEEAEIHIEDPQLFDDIYSSFDMTSGWASDYNRHDYENESWYEFRSLVKSVSVHKLFSRPITKLKGKKIKIADFLEELADKILAFNMMTQWNRGKTLIRCRQHIHKHEITFAKDICSPPVKYTTQPNRMSTAGTSMFYGAFDKKTALSETLDLTDKTKLYYTTAEFKTRRNFLLVDLTKIPSIPSIFDQKQWDNYHVIAFLHGFVKDFSAPIKRDGKEHIEYAPTQVITEFLRQRFSSGKIKIDGVIYPSSKNRSDDACVLFFDHEKSLKELDFSSASLVTNTIS